MLSIRDKELPQDVIEYLLDLQGGIDNEASYEAKVALADLLWSGKQSTKAGRAAIKELRDTLSQMCIGSVRCAYCEDSAADEVEHIRPKSLFPELTFVWANHCFACGPCNGPKNNRYGTVLGGTLAEFIRRKGGPIVPPPSGQAALIDPRAEDPTDFLELDLGGVLPNGTSLEATFEFLPRETLGVDDLLRAEFTIDVLGLNRELLRASRANSFGGFRARLAEYAAANEASASADHLRNLKTDLLRTPHLTVFHEMRRQRGHLPDIGALFNRVPETLAWPLTVEPIAA